MLKSMVKYSVLAILITIVIGSAVTLQTHAGFYFQRCPFPSCAVLPHGNARVLCKRPMNGPIYVEYLNQCCCNNPDGWQNLFAFINVTW